MKHGRCGEMFAQTGPNKRNITAGNHEEMLCQTASICYQKNNFTILHESIQDTMDRKTIVGNHYKNQFQVISRFKRKEY